MKHVLCSLFIALSAFSYVSFGQDLKPDTGDTITVGKPTTIVVAAFGKNAYTPKVISPSPDAASLGRYGEIPVELSKGTPSITIPLYEIQSGSLKVPISLSYHASGVRVNDVATSVGLSWTLNAGGAITRAVNGLPDEFSVGFRTMPFPQETNFNDFMCTMGRLAAEDGTLYDGSSDYYYYNYNQTSGKYMWANRKRTADLFFTPVAVPIPYKPIKIEPNGQITEADGTIYRFGSKVNDKISHETTSANEGPTNFTSTFYMSHMISANRIDTVYFEYTDPVSVSALPIWLAGVSDSTLSDTTDRCD